MSSGTTITKTFCAFCGSGCGIEVHVADGRVQRVVGDKASRIGQGILCPKAAAAVDVHRHRDRLNYPLKRAGARGEGKWQRIGWEEALDEIAGKLADIRDRFGPEALVYLGGTQRAPGDWCGWRFCNLFGTPNIFGQGKNCGEAEFLAEWAVYGGDTFVSSPIPGATKCYVLWGTNPAESAHLRFRSLERLKEAGAKIVVVDPRYTETAKLADLWLPLRPATDGALALGMLNVIIAEERYDKDFVAEWCLGFDQIAQRVAEYPPERVAEITNLPAEQIVEVARLYATNRPAIMSVGCVTCQLSHAALSAVLGKALLRAITGNLEVRGGQTFRAPFADLKWPENLYWDKMVDHPLRTRDNVSAEQFPIASVKSYSLYRKAMAKVYPAGYPASQYMLWVTPPLVWPAITEGKPYPLRAAITLGGNPLVTLAGGRTIHDALVDEKLELHVGMDLFMTPTVQLADYVLPAADFMERSAALCGWGLADYWYVSEKAVEPLHERRDDYQFWRGLGVRLGQQEHWPDTYEQLVEQFASPTGQSFAQLVADDNRIHSAPRSYGKHKANGFATFSGKVELVPSLLATLGYDPLVQYEEAAQSPSRTPDLAKEYPFVLISGSRLRWYVHSTLRQVPRLRRRHPDPLLSIHPDAAGLLGIADGDWVFIETTVGRIRQKAHVTASIPREVVHADGYWWCPEKPAESLYGMWDCSINTILPDGSDFVDFAGDQFLRGPLCRVYKADEDALKEVPRRPGDLPSADERPSRTG